MKAASEGSPDPFALVGSTLAGTYQIDGVIGSGSHGILFSARHLRMSSRCAIKLLSLPPGQRRDMLLSAVGSGASMSHPHIVPHFDATPLPDGTLLLCSALLEGEDLANRVALRGRLTQAEGLLLLRQVAAGLLSLHRRGLAHGNLTARNIFLLRFDDVAIDDAFGESKGAQKAVLLDMGLGHCDGSAASAADDQRALALLLLEHVADLSLQQRRVLERAQAALAQTRFPSMQELFQAFTGDQGPASRETALTPRGAAGAASTQTAVVPRKKGKPAPARETHVISRDRRSKAAPGPGSEVSGDERRRQIVRIGAIAGVGLLALLGGIGGGLLWKHSRASAPVETQQAETQQATAALKDGGKKAQAPLEVQVRFTLSPAGTEVLIEGAPLPMGNMLKLPRQERPLKVVARAPGHMPYEGILIPDRDQAMDIALIPEGKGGQVAPADKGHKQHHRHGLRGAPLR